MKAVKPAKEARGTARIYNSFFKIVFTALPAVQSANDTDFAISSR